MRAGVTARDHASKSRANGRGYGPVNSSMDTIAAVASNRALGTLTRLDALRVMVGFFARGSSETKQTETQHERNGPISDWHFSDICHFGDLEIL